MDIIAHRCGTDKFPQLTIESALNSLKMGASLVEMDLRFTKDGYPVICHDKNMKALFGYDKQISDIDLKEFLSLRHRLDSGFKSHTFEDFLKSGISNILLHIKEGGIELKSVFDLCKYYKAENNVVFGVQNKEDMAVIREMSKNVKILAFIPKLSDLDYFKHADVDIIRLWEQWVEPEIVKSIHKEDKKVWVMANNKKVEKNDCGYTTGHNILEWQSFGVDGVILNNVESAMSVINDSGVIEQL